jgi:hypothetical protein
MLCSKCGLGRDADNIEASILGREAAENFRSEDGLGAIRRMGKFASEDFRGSKTTEKSSKYANLLPVPDQEINIPSKELIKSPPTPSFLKERICPKHKKTRIYDHLDPTKFSCLEVDLDQNKLCFQPTTDVDITNKFSQLEIFVSSCNYYNEPDKCNICGDKLYREEEFYETYEIPYCHKHADEFLLVYETTQEEMYEDEFYLKLLDSLKPYDEGTYIEETSESCTCDPHSRNFSTQLNMLNKYISVCDHCGKEKENNTNETDPILKEEDEFSENTRSQMALYTLSKTILKFCKTIAPTPALKYLLDLNKFLFDPEQITILYTFLKNGMEERLYQELLSETFTQGIESMRRSIKAVDPNFEESPDFVNTDIKDADLNPVEQEDGLVNIWKLIYKSCLKENNKKAFMNISLKSFQEYYFNIWGPYGTGKSYQTRRLCKPNDVIVCASFALKLEYVIKLSKERGIDCPFKSEEPPNRKELSLWLKSHSGRDLPYIKTFQVAAMIPRGARYDTWWVDECYMQSMMYSFLYQMFNFLENPNTRSSVVMVGDHLQVNAPDFQKVSSTGKLITFNEFREFLKPDHIHLLNVTFRCGLDTVYYMIKNYGYPSNMRSCNPNKNTYQIHENYPWSNPTMRTPIKVKLSGGKFVTKRGNEIIGEHAMVMHQTDKDSFHFAQINTVAEYQGNEKHVCDLYLRRNYRKISSGHEVVALTRHIDTLHVVFEQKQNTFFFLKQRPTIEELTKLFISKEKIPQWDGFLNLRKDKMTEFTVRFRTEEATMPTSVTYYWCNKCSRNIDDYYFEDDLILCSIHEIICEEPREFIEGAAIDDNEESIGSYDKCLVPNCSKKCFNIKKELLCSDHNQVYKYRIGPDTDKFDSIDYVCRECGADDFKHKRECKYFKSAVQTQTTVKTARSSRNTKLQSEYPIKDWDLENFNTMKKQQPIPPKGYVTILTPCNLQFKHKDDIGDTFVGRNIFIKKHIDSNCGNRFCTEPSNYRIIQK